MDAADVIRAIDAEVERLRTAHWKERDAIRDRLLALARQVPVPEQIADHLEQARKGLSLEQRWEIDEVLEALKPPPAPEPEPEPEADDRPLSMADLDLVYDDPRGFQLLRSRRGPERWFATQRDPRTGQPQTFELQSRDLVQLKAQLAGSPYWVLGSGAAI